MKSRGNLHWKLYFCLISTEGRANCSFQRVILSQDLTSARSKPESDNDFNNSNSTSEVVNHEIQMAGIAGEGATIICWAEETDNQIESRIAVCIIHCSRTHLHLVNCLPCVNKSISWCECHAKFQHISITIVICHIGITIGNMKANFLLDKHFAWNALYMRVWCPINGKLHSS